MVDYQCKSFYAVQDLLPEEVVWRKKSPYPKSHNPAYFTAVKNILKEARDLWNKFHGTTARHS